MPLAPASAGRPAARNGTRSDCRDLTAMARVTSSVPVCSDVTGHRPAFRPACARPMNRMPKSRPAASPSNRPAPSLPRTEPLAATSTMAGSETSTPATASTLGCSPSAMPAATGTTAAPTAETGPTGQAAGQPPGDRPDVRPGAAGHDERRPGQHGGDGRAEDGDPDRSQAPGGQASAEVGAAVQQGRGQAEQDS